LVRQLLERYSVEPQWLVIEVTESIIMADPARALEIIGQLHGLGVSLSIDDFGTGYSSLAYLKHLPVGELKIDQSFVRDMTVDDSDKAIVRSTIDLGHNLGLKVVAEGVETEEAWDRLGELGCDVGQGYHLGHPMPANEFERWIEESDWGHSRAGGPQRRVLDAPDRSLQVA
ncbi:MAG: EAL domain-containing protein, partial [Chloroflexota bacterium]|nr:EAL domain-containing protein [Chloroflexota bacterium]